VYRSNAPLRNHEIAQLHTMHEAGQPINAISAAIGIHRNRVRQYLQFRVAYPPEALQRFIRKAPKLKKRFPMRLSEASPLLPGWPSDAKITDLRKAGVIKARRSSQKGRALMVTEKQVVRAAEQMMPLEGLFLRSDSMSRLSYIEVTDHLERHHMRYWPSREFFWIAATEIREDLHVPAAQVHIANLCLQITGRALLT